MKGQLLEILAGSFLVFVLAALVIVMDEYDLDPSGIKNSLICWKYLPDIVRLFQV